MEEKSVIHTKAVREDGFVFSLTARNESLEDCYADINLVINQGGLMPWRETTNLLDRKAPTNNMIDEAKELGAIRFLGTKTLPPKKEQCEPGDAYKIGVSSYSFDGEYLKFWKKIDGELIQWGINPIKVGTPSWAEFEQVFPDWEVEIAPKGTELPMGAQYLYYEISERTNNNGNHFHDLKGTEPA